MNERCKSANGFAPLIHKAGGSPIFRSAGVPACDFLHRPGAGIRMMRDGRKGDGTAGRRPNSQPGRCATRSGRDRVTVSLPVVGALYALWGTGHAMPRHQGRTPMFCSAGVPACEFQHRPGAGIRMMREGGKGDGTAGRCPNSQPGRLRYTERTRPCNRVSACRRRVVRAVGSEACNALTPGDRIVSAPAPRLSEIRIELRFVKLLQELNPVFDCCGSDSL